MGHQLRMTAMLQNNYGTLRILLEHCRQVLKHIAFFFFWDEYFLEMLSLIMLNRKKSYERIWESESLRLVMTTEADPPEEN